MEMKNAKNEYMENLVEIQYAQTGQSSATNDMGMREMQAIVYKQSTYW